LLAVGQVAGDFEEAADLAGFVAQGGDDDAGPEPRAVLAEPPALVLEPARCDGHAQLVVGPAGRDGVGRVEAGEVLADDVLSPEALDPLSPGVPGNDVAVAVEEEDGVIPNAGHQLPEVLLALPQPRLRPVLAGARRLQGLVAGSRESLRP